MSLVALHGKYSCDKKEKKMKKLWKSIYCILESLGRARAASSLARQGNYKLAQQIMSEKSKCC